MIINGGGRGNVGYWSQHLLREDTNERVEVKELSGVLADDLPGALREMELVASGSRCQRNFMYVADISPEAHERLTEEQWREAVDLLEEKMKLQDHQRVIVEHEKDGRVHRHVVWNRVGDDLKVRDIGGDYYTHERVARALEERFDLERTPSRHGMQHDNGPRPPRAPDVQDYRMAEKAGTTPEERKAAITEAWRQSDSADACRAALDEAGYVLARGDKRDFVVVDQAGGVHSLARQIDGVSTKEVRERLAELSSPLLTVTEAKVLQAERQEQRQVEAEQVKTPAEVKPELPPATPSPTPPQVDPREAIAVPPIEAAPQIEVPPGKPMETIRTGYPTAENSEPVTPPPEKSWRELKNEERKEVLTTAWNQSKNGREFCEAVNKAGYVIAVGDHDNLLVVDRRGYPASLPKSIDEGAEFKRHIAHLKQMRLPNFRQAQVLQERAAATGEPLDQRPPPSLGDMIKAKVAAAKQEAAQIEAAQAEASKTDAMKNGADVPPVFDRMLSMLPVTERIAPVAAEVVGENEQRFHDRLEKGETPPVPAAKAAPLHETQRPPEVLPEYRVERIGQPAAVEAEPVKASGHQPEAAASRAARPPPSVPPAYRVERFAASPLQDVRPFTGTEREIIRAWGEAESPEKFVEKLSERGLTVAAPSENEIDDTLEQARWARQNGHRSPQVYRAGEYVVVNGLGRVTHLRPEMFGVNSLREIDQKLSGLDRNGFKDVSSTKAEQMQEKQKSSSMKRDADIAMTPTVTRKPTPAPVAAAKVGFKVFDGATGIMTGLLDFLSGSSEPPLPPPRHEVERRQRHEAAMVALENVLDAAAKGEALKAEDIRHLSPEHRENIRLRGDDAVRALIEEAKYFERERDRDRSRGR